MPDGFCCDSACRFSGDDYGGIMKKKTLLTILCAAAFVFSAGSCSSDPDKEGNDGMKAKGTIAATVFDNSEVKNIEDTQAGDIASWQAQVFTKSGGNNDMPTTDALIKSPWHTLKVNGKTVPVYTARCGKGSHSYAWVDLLDNTKDFALETELTLSESAAKCVVLPLNKNVEAKKSGNTYSAFITAYGSYTFTFAESADAEATDPTFAPMTLMVTQETPLKTPEGYNRVDIEAGYHADYDLEFSEEETVYYFKKGLHEISSINVPSNSIVYLERGAYLKVTDRGSDSTGWNSNTALHTERTENVKVLGRGLLDCGEVLGGDSKHKHVVNVGSAKNVLIEGLTVINSNTWTMCAYNSDNVQFNANLLLSFRTYSDGLMFSECTNSSGRYNFVRTGDDAIEYKGTGWQGGSAQGSVGNGNVFEYNDCWTDKGSGYCLTWESECDMTDMVFRNNNVGFAQPTWSSGNNALDCRLGTNATKTWENVTFENIEIYRCISPNVMICQVSGRGGNLKNILFKDIKVHSTETGVFAFTMNYSAQGGVIENITLQNIDFCGKKLTSADKADSALFRNLAGKYFDELTVK